MRKLKREEIYKAIINSQWQTIRLSLKGISTRDKIKALKSHYNASRDKNQSEIQVVNYINALKRGGQLSKNYNIKL